VSVDRRAELRALLAMRGTTAATWLSQVCELCVTELAISGARIQVLGRLEAQDGGATIYSTDELSTQLGALATTAGVGPCIDAFESRWPVLVPDLAAELVRWPGFVAEAVSAGAAAVFAFPLQVGVVRVGVLVLHRSRPGALSPVQLTDALLLADAALDAILDDLRGAGPDSVVSSTVSATMDIDAEVHQATGFVAAELGVSMGEALSRIRGHAFARRLPLSEVARGILERRLRLDDGEE
jgi:ANTAR domain-containing protein